MLLMANNEILKDKFRVVFKKFIYQTAEIYGGEKGLYDYGMNADAMMDNIIQQWKMFFVVQEDMLKVKCTMLTPEKVLKASGHVDRFNDFIVDDVVTGESFRADHLIEKFLDELIKDKAMETEKVKEISDIIQKIDNFGEQELCDLIRTFNITSPENNAISSPRPFNLMFSTSIGPSGMVKGYLRPETAQGIFINFKRLLEDKQGKLPFAVAQIGSSFRNEIAPRSGLLRVREFEMAEIEHFLDPLDKSHVSFETVAHLNIHMFPSADQMAGGSASLINLGEAVAKGQINNQTLGYFMGRIYLFLIKIGIKHDLVRFRQHMPNEMAHYASDCWDAECQTSYGWVECVGCADRSCYDLERHSECSGVKLVAQRTLSAPRAVKRVYCKPNMKVLGTTFKKNAAVVSKYLTSLPVAEVTQVLAEGRDVTYEGLTFTVTAAMGDMVDEDMMVLSEEFVPSVIEPSFGLGRIFYSMMEQNFAVRAEDEERIYFTVPPQIAAYKFAILPLSANDGFVLLTRRIRALLTELNIMSTIDASSASIGKRYSRKDMIGVPFGITVDFDSLAIEPTSVTVRERDSMAQIRVTVDQLPALATALVAGTLSWTEATTLYPVFEGQVNK